MSVLMMRLTLGILFLILGAMLLCRELLFPGLFAQYDPIRLNLGGILALVFGGLNLARWYAARAVIEERRKPVHRPLQRDPSATPQEGPNPEFDFTKRDDSEGNY